MRESYGGVCPWKKGALSAAWRAVDEGCGISTVAYGGAGAARRVELVRARVIVSRFGSCGEIDAHEEVMRFEAADPEEAAVRWRTGVR